MTPERSFSANHAAKIANLTYRQLDYWARTGFVQPSLAAANGKGSQRSYSYDDLLELKTVKHMLDLGMDLKRVRAIMNSARSRLRQDHEDVALVHTAGRWRVVHGLDAQEIALWNGEAVLPLDRQRLEVDAALRDLAKAGADV